MVRLSNIVQQNNPISFSFTAPTAPLSGDEWVDLNSGIKYIYFIDSDTSQWVQFDAAQVYTTSGGTTSASDGLAKALALIYGE
jgi:hypothetical protein